LRPTGSLGRQSVAAARELVAGYRPARADGRPAYDYVPPGPSDVGAPWSPGDPDAPKTGPVLAAAADLRAGVVTSRQLVEDSLLAVEKHDAELMAVVHLMDDAALAEAAACDAEAAAGHWRGPLHGIPVTVKDIIDVAGAPTRCGSAAYHDVPAVDAVGVARLRSAGAIVLAKVSTHEFALGVTTPQSRNPHDQSRIPGGSSGGSAIAVSTGMGLASLGTDTRASIRVPAALSGVVGFKPTYGSVPTGGVVPLSWTMDHVAAITSSVADAALVVDVLRQRRTADRLVDRAGTSVAGLRVGVPEAAFAAAEPGVEACVREALDGLAAMGCVVSSAARPTAGDLEAANAAGLLVSRCEAAAFHRRLGLDRSQYWDEVADQLDAAGELSALEYLDAQTLRADLAAGFLGIFADFDVLAMPTVPAIAPPVDDFARHLMLLSRNAIPWSLTGFPALSVPCGWSEGLPVGLQLVAAPWREDLIVAVGCAVERCRTGW
jgi:aspartyl-tRNA(Asn)/glutamyl-tRNA(Gln) amidotransferase subunit A